MQLTNTHSEITPRMGGVPVLTNLKGGFPPGPTVNS